MQRGPGLILVAGGLLSLSLTVWLAFRLAEHERAHRLVRSRRAEHAEC